jgi:hypothetical protein
LRKGGIAMIKKILILMFLIMAAASLSDHPQVLPYKEKLFGMFQKEATQATQVKGGQSLRQVQKELTAIGQRYGQGQLRALQEASADAASALAFHQKYCVTGEFHPLLYGDAIREVCNVLSYQAAGLASVGK